MKTKHIGYWILYFATIIATLIILSPDKRIFNSILKHLVDSFRSPSEGILKRNQSFVMLINEFLIVLLTLLIAMLVWTRKIKQKMSLRNYTINKYVLVAFIAITAFNVISLTYNYYFVFKEFKSSGVDSVRIEKENKKALVRELFCY